MTADSKDTNETEAPDSAPAPAPAPDPAVAAAASIPQHEEPILPASHWANAPVPVHDDDADSGFGDTESSTASITSSILAYRTINGRRYHSERGNASYWAANDEKQMESMDLFHHVCYLLNGRRNFRAPVEAASLRKALDVGTGLGAWAIDFADDFPDCEVIGTDVSPIQPTWVPPNVKFEIEDCTQDWTFAENSFDYVHMRLLYGSISDWKHLFNQAYRVCKPGGWIESFEASALVESDDGTVPPNSAMAQWGKFFIEGGRKLGRTFEIIQKDVQINEMKRLGLEDISVHNVKCPTGSWPKDPTQNELGRIALATMSRDYEGYVSYMASTTLGWSREEVDVYCAHLRAEFRSPRHHGYFRFRGVYGRKPLSANQAED